MVGGNVYTSYLTIGFICMTKSRDPEEKTSSYNRILEFFNSLHGK